MKIDASTSGALRLLLSPLAWVYGLIIRWRNRRYDHATGVHAAGVPVISVGNITAGGTGKTPFVIELVRRLRARGRRPAILTRGYKGRPGRTADEVLEFHDAVPDVPVVVNPRRVAGAATARQEHGADCLVLDDGFQHRALARELDIVLVDALAPWGGGRLLPAGRLREPLSGLARAGLFVITRANQVSPEVLDEIAARLHELGGAKPVVWADVEPAELVERDGTRLSLADARGRRVVAACGLGNPRTFERLVGELFDVGATLTFADHHRYAPGDVARMQAAARAAQAGVVVTTRKDWVKLAPLWPASGPELVRLDVRLALRGAVEELDAAMTRVLESRP